MMSGPATRAPFMFYYFFISGSVVYGSDGANICIVNPALLSHFSELFMKILSEKGRGTIFSPLVDDVSKRYVLLTDTEKLHASIIDHRAAQSLSLTINFPDYELQPEHTPA